MQVFDADIRIFV